MHREKLICALNCMVTDGHEKWIEAKARADGISKGEVVRRALDSAIDSDRRKFTYYSRIFGDQGSDSNQNSMLTANLGDGQVIYLEGVEG